MICFFFIKNSKTKHCSHKSKVQPQWKKIPKQHIALVIKSGTTVEDMIEDVCVSLFFLEQVATNMRKMKTATTTTIERSMGQLMFLSYGAKHCFVLNSQSFTKCPGESIALEQC